VIRLIRPKVTETGLDLKQAELTLEHIKDIPCPAGSGPRHMEFNSEGTILYCIAELSGEVLVYDICHDGETPEFTLKQQIQADEVNAGGSADIHIHPSGRWLYTSHRLKNDGIAAFHIFPDGSLELLGDAQIRSERVAPEQVRAVVTGLRRGKKLHDERSLRWRFFRGPWRHIRRLRPYVNRIRQFFRR
jgi:hypothetical protein